MAPGCPEENVLLAYSQRLLPDDEARAVEAHLDGCSLCLALVGEAARGDEVTTLPERPLARPMMTPSLATDDVRRGAVLGRYVVIDKLGAGGMGVVLSAYDPKLDRKVALKLVRSRACWSARTRSWWPAHWKPCRSCHACPPAPTWRRSSP